MYKSSDMPSSTHDMNAPLGKDTMCVTTDNTAIVATVKHLTKGIHTGGQLVFLA
jgi:hypothetical protein